MGVTQLVTPQPGGGKRLIMPAEREVPDHKKSLTLSAEVRTYRNGRAVIFVRLGMTDPWGFRVGDARTASSSRGSSLWDNDPGSLALVRARDSVAELVAHTTQHPPVKQADAGRVVARRGRRSRFPKWLRQGHNDAARERRRSSPVHIVRFDKTNLVTAPTSFPSERYPPPAACTI